MKNSTLLLLAVIFIPAFASAQTIKPYLQAAQPTSVYINWKTDNGTNPSVSYGATAAALDQTAAGTTADLEPKDSDYTTPYHYHSVKLTGLTPNTGYYYRANSGTTNQSAVHYFKTPPAYGSDSEVLRYIALGDHQIINHQGAPYMKYNELVQAAKAQAEAEYGTPLADNFNLIINDGDQVDLGRLSHYEQIHFEKSSYLTPELPIITAVGNHETYGNTYQNGGIQAYYDHFVLDDGFVYGGIDSGTERYYAYQQANVLFIAVDTELNGTTQQNWITNVINYAAADADVDWIITVGHRPYEAEQYSNDYSPWYATTVLPLLKATDKFVLHIAGHHHMYARGQFKDHNAYHIISGGTAWPQYWGDSNSEDDREETQGSWSNFAFQLIEIDNPNQELTIKSYSIGSLTTSKSNELLDEVHYKLGTAVPAQPVLTNTVSGPVALPFTLTGSAYNTSTAEPLNSARYQISSTSDFSIINIDRFQHVTNFYGPDGTQTDETADIGLGADVINYTVAPGALTNGTYYARVQYRDANLGWSAWSPSLQFEVAGSQDGTASLFLDEEYYDTGANITATFQNAPGNTTDWVGIYNNGATPGVNGSVTYQYTNGDINGVRTFNLSNAGVYFAGFFANDGYTELADRVSFRVGATAVLSTNTVNQSGDPVTVSYTQHPNQTTDKIGIYPTGVEPTADNEVQRAAVNTSTGSTVFNGLADGYYYAVYHVSDTYVVSGERVNFQVGTQITDINTTKTIFAEGEAITVDFTDAPGLEKDYIGIIIDDGMPAGTDNLYTYKYFDGATNGTTTIDGTEQLQGSPNQLPPPGDYYLAMFTNDSYTQVSNSIDFSVSAAATAMDCDKVQTGETFEVEYSDGPGNNLDWVGAYPVGATPGQGPFSSSWAYVTADGDGDNANGTLTLNGINTPGDYFIGFFVNDGYTETAPRINFTVSAEVADLTLATDSYETGENIPVTYAGGPGGGTDWIGAYQVGQSPGTGSPSTSWQYVQSGSESAGTVTLNGINTEGDYYVVMMENNGYNEVSCRTSFTVANALPVELADFRAQKIGEKEALLTWETLAEINHAYFDIERKDANGTFTKIGTLRPVVENAGEQYRFADRNPTVGDNYYRLKQVDTDGTFTYSDVRKVTFAAGKNKVIIFPNPTEGIATIQAGTPIRTVSINDAAGKTVTAQWQTDGNLGTINLRNLPAGLYFVTVTAENGTTEVLRLQLR